jgi:hypothetical protein
MFSDVSYDYQAMRLRLGEKSQRWTRCAINCPAEGLSYSPMSRPHRRNRWLAT